MDLIEIEGFSISSIKYRSRNEGRAIKIKMIAGKIVHVVSTICSSIGERLISLLIDTEIIMYKTIEVIIIIIIIE